MKRLAWGTDLHLDMADDAHLKKFVDQCVATNADAVVLTGDISNGRHVIRHLSALEHELERPIFFVGGNHDYYHGSIEMVRKQMGELSALSGFLKYMPTTSYHAFTPTTAIVGHDGWYDALNGDWERAGFLMNDWYRIHEFASIAPWNASQSSMIQVKPPSMGGIISLARKLAHEGVTHVANGIKAAVRYHKEILVLTHVPPFPQCATHEGKLQDASHLPFYTSKFMGDLLLGAAKAFPAVKFTVLCGHTHGRWSGAITKNLEVHVGGAEYGDPEIQRVIEVP